MSEPDDIYGVAFQRVDAATTAALIRARPPHRDLGAFMRLVDGARQNQRNRTIAPGPRIVEVIEAVLREDEARLVLVEVELTRWITTWPHDGCRQAVQAVDAHWTEPSPWIRRIRDRLQAWAELRELGLEPPAETALEYLLDLGRPPLVAEPAFLEGLLAAGPGLTPDALRIAGKLAAERAPTAARLLGPQVERAAALWESHQA